MSKTVKANDYTPGPWDYVPGMVVGGHLVASCGCEQGVFADQPVGEFERPANAKLIAAAPDLLAACKAILAWADKECMPQGGKNDGPWELAEAAIRKAGPK